ncbi:hypothetical protein BJX68DRAFT_253389 [Aspergillus pseudodeflectus]|uniref:Phospholipid/glycerol acyltransferase domain-containing protein n=1 Tax=Aspergillus pseudodeflectus TaxID=176178 RepID=A0ABR4KVV1_9EURO
MSRQSDTGATGESPSAFWRGLSSTTIVGVAALCRSFLYACSRPETHGLEPFLELLDSRKDPSQRTKGLLTELYIPTDADRLANRMDDPLMWGFLPLKYQFGLSSSNRRWGLASHDICYQTRSAHSQYGGIAQPAVTQAIRLLSKGPFAPEPHLALPERQSWSLQNVCVDPFSDLPTAYTTDGHDSHLAPSAFACNSYSWVHIFPEGKIHQAPSKTMRYFKWGVARLILEASECPDVVPIWLEGFDHVMHESREFPRFLPRPGKEVSVTFGQKVDTDAVFGEYRSRWEKLKAKAEKAAPETRDLPLGALNDELLYGAEAVELRKEVTKKVRDLVLEVRRSRGLSDEDPKAGLVETWMEEGPKREGKMADESWVRDKHHRNTFAKPISTPHHTLATSGFRAQNDRFRSSAASPGGEQPSVNDLIHHLRRTQVSASATDTNRSPSRQIAPRSLPETPPPRPRPDARRTGIVGRRLRRTAGPPPPESWLSGNSAADNEEESELDAAEMTKIIYRLERLPGKEFPAKSSFLHALLKSMAMHWAWHIAYDGQFLALLPTHIKPLQGLMRGLKPLFENVESDSSEQVAAADREVTHLDLSGAIGRWMSLKQLPREVLLPKKPVPVQIDAPGSVPSSWDEELEEGVDTSSSTRSTIPKSYLSLAHPNPASVNWNSLIHLLSRLPTITHLSLAHWPVPTITPHALKASIRHPTHRSLTFSYGGTDSYSAIENNWAESAGILRKLSRVTYCLKWLDLEGCGGWIPALNWEGVGPQGEAYTTGPEWNGSWRDIEWIHESDIPMTALTSTNTHPPSPRSLASSIHAAPSPSHIATPGETSSNPTGSSESWDVEVERRKYRLGKELERFRESIRSAKAVQRRVLQSRKEGRGKWVQFSFGLEGLEESLLETLLGPEFEIGLR